MSTLISVSDRITRRRKAEGCDGFEIARVLHPSSFRPRSHHTTDNPMQVGAVVHRGPVTVPTSSRDAAGAAQIDGSTGTRALGAGLSGGRHRDNHGPICRTHSVVRAAMDKRCPPVGLGPFQPDGRDRRQRAGRVANCAAHHSRCSASSSVSADRRVGRHARLRTPGRGGRGRGRRRPRRCGARQRQLRGAAALARPLPAATSSRRAARHPPSGRQAATASAVLTPTQNGASTAGSSHLRWRGHTCSARAHVGPVPQPTWPHAHERNRAHSIVPLMRCLPCHCSSQASCCPVTGACVRRPRLQGVQHVGQKLQRPFHEVLDDFTPVVTPGERPAKASPLSNRGRA